MHITVDSLGTVALDEPAVFTAFDLRVSGGQRATALEALGDDASEATEADHLFVAVDRVRSLAQESLGGAFDAEWETNFQGMLGYAGSKGWMSPDGAAIKAHVVDSD